MIFEKTEKRPVIFILLTVISICVLCGCVAYRYVTPYNTYNHEQHENALLARDMDCFSCHVVDVDERDPLTQNSATSATLTKKQSRRKRPPAVAFAMKT